MRLRATPQQPAAVRSRPIKVRPQRQQPEHTIVRDEYRGAERVIQLTTLPAEPGGEASVRDQLRRRGQGGRLLLFWVIISIGVMGSSLVGGLWLVQRISERPCQGFLPMRSASEHLYCQEAAAIAGDPEAGFRILVEASQWTAEHPLYTEQQKTLDIWSKWAFTQAQATLDRGELTQALVIARRIPANSPQATTVQTAIADWQTQWQQAEQLEQAFEQAIATQQWQQALKITTQLAQSPLVHWRRDRTDQLLERLTLTKRQAQPVPSPIPQNLPPTGQ